jgi:hypothetical protein
MITEEQFKEAQRIIDEYQHQEMVANEPDDDEDDDYFERAQEQRDEDRAFLAATCKCGAWSFSADKTQVIHSADCCCGAE